MSHIPGISMKVLTTLAAYRIVSPNTAGAHAVVYPSAATVRPIGITQDTVKDTNQAIPVAIHGISKLLFNETMSTGGMVAADSAGRGVPHADTTAGSYVIGCLIGPNVSQTGTLADVLIGVHFKSIP